MSLLADNGKEGVTVSVKKMLLSLYEKAEELFRVPSSLHVYRVF